MSRRRGETRGGGSRAKSRVVACLCIRVRRLPCWCFRNRNTRTSLTRSAFLVLAQTEHVGGDAVEIDRVRDALARARRRASLPRRGLFGSRPRNLRASLALGARRTRPWPFTVAQAVRLHEPPVALAPLLLERARVVGRLHVHAGRAVRSTVEATPARRSLPPGVGRDGNSAGGEVVGEICLRRACFVRRLARHQEEPVHRVAVRRAFLAARRLRARRRDHPALGPVRVFGGGTSTLRTFSAPAPFRRRRRRGGDDEYTFAQCGALLSCASFLYPPKPTTATAVEQFSPLRRRTTFSSCAPARTASATRRSSAVWLQRRSPKRTISFVRLYVCACPLTMNAPCFRQISNAPQPVESPLYEHLHVLLVHVPHAHLEPGRAHDSARSRTTRPRAGWRSRRAASTPTEEITSVTAP